MRSCACALSRQPNLPPTACAGDVEQSRGACGDRAGILASRRARPLEPLPDETMTPARLNNCEPDPVGCHVAASAGLRMARCSRRGKTTLEASSIAGIRPLRSWPPRQTGEQTARPKRTNSV